MAYTYEQLTKAYTAVHGVEPTGEAASQLRLLTNVSYTDTQRLSWILNSADTSTSVAVLSYQFFTGKAPSAEGMDYLLKSGEKNLNSETYAKFNLENRFMNFATNLALQGEGKAAFEANYGSMTYAQYVASIYESIIGKAQATAAGLNPEQTILDIIGRQDLILQSARNNGVIGPNATAAEIDLALKAATAAYLLAEGIKADVGVYAGATNNFMVGVATGKAAYGTDILTTHAPTPGSDSSGVGNTIDNPPAFEDLPGAPPPPQPEPEPPAPSLVLTLGNDTLIGTDGDDTFTGTDLTFGFNDVLEGGAGRDTLVVTGTPGAGHDFDMPNNGITGIEVINITSDGGFTTYLPYVPDVTELNITAGAGLVNVTVNPTATVTATVTGQADHALYISGGSDISLTSTGATIGRIVIGDDGEPTGDVVVSRALTGAVNGGSIEVNGGETISITQTADTPTAGPQKNGQVLVHGSALTTEVTVKAAQAFSGGGASRTANSVSISDDNYGSSTLAGTITKVAVDSYTTFTFSGSGLTDLSLAHGSGDITLNKGNLATPANTTLDLALNGLTGGVLHDVGGHYRTLNVTTGAVASTLGGIDSASLYTLDIEGDSVLTVQGSPTLNALQNVIISGAASLNADLSNTSVTTIQALGSTGVNTLKIDASRATFIGGAGDDRITLSAATVSQIINLGDGDDTLTLATGMTISSLGGVINGGAGANTLNLDADSAAQISAGGAPSKISNFQTVVLTDVNGQTIDMGLLGGVASTVRVASGIGSLTLTGATALETLELTGFGVNHNLTGDWSGADDALTVKLSSHTSMTFSSGFSAAGVETAHFVTHDTVSSPSAADEAELTWLGDDLTTITVSGNAGLYLQAASSAVTSVDATGLTQGDFTWWGADLVNDITIKGSLTGENGIALNSSKAINYTGGSASDYIGVQNGYDHVISVGAGNDEVSVGWGANKVDVGTGTDTVFLKGGNAAGRTIFTEITGMSGGDMLVVSSIDDRKAATLGAEVTGPTDFDAFLDAAAAGDGSGTALMRWFDFGGDTYVVLDASSHATFQQGQDVVVKLVGGFDLSASTVSGSGGGPGTLTLVDILPI